MKIDKKSVFGIIDEWQRITPRNMQMLFDKINTLPTSEDEWVSIDRVVKTLDDTSKSYPKVDWLTAYKNDVVCELERLSPPTK